MCFGFGKSETPIRVKDCGLMRGGHMDLGIVEGAKAKAHREIGDREFMRTGTHVVEDHETPTLEASIGRCARWIHEEYHVKASGNTRREEERERWDPMTSLKAMWAPMNVPHATVVKDDSCAVGPENKVTRNFGNSRDEGMGARH
jgi:hypothetical protein